MPNDCASKIWALVSKYMQHGAWKFPTSTTTKGRWDNNFTSTSSGTYWRSYLPKIRLKMGLLRLQGSYNCFLLVNPGKVPVFGPQLAFSLTALWLGGLSPPNSLG